MNKFILRNIFLLIFIGLTTSNVLAQADSSTTVNPFSVSCDLMSRYVWRGTDFGASPSIQPGITFTKGNFVAGVWGAYATNSRGTQEADLFASYTLKKHFTFTITDYFFPDEVNTYNYFNYQDSTTGHVFEASISYSGPDKFPITLLLATNFYGADAHKLKADGSQGGIQYSTYAEVSYAFKYADVFMGTNLTNVDRSRGESGFYGDYLGVVNFGITTTKDIKITNDFSLPLKVLLITNPQAHSIFLVAGFSF